MSEETPMPRSIFPLGHYAVVSDEELIAQMKQIATNSKLTTVEDILDKIDMQSIEDEINKSFVDFIYGGE